MEIAEVYERLKELSEITGMNDKVERLKQLLIDRTFLKVVQYALDGQLHYKFKDIGVWQVDNASNYNISDSEMFEYLDYLASKSGATNEDKKVFINLWSESYNSFEVGRMILNKDLRCGVSGKTVNKALPGTIRIIPYQRCSTSSNIDKITFPAIIQTKADAMFSYASNIFLHMFMTRTGKTFGLFDLLEVHMDYWIDAVDDHFPSPVFMGELCVVDDKEKVLDRKTSNGIMNKFIKGTGTEEEAERVRYVIWDVISAEDWENNICNVPYGVRWDTLQTLTKELGSLVQLIDSERVDSVSEAMGFYNKMRDAGEEGAILKDINSVWKSNTCSTTVKLKNVSTAEFKIIGVNRGKGKLSDRMGSLTVATSDRGIITNVGSGFSDAERDLEFWMQSIGNIVSVNFESVIKDKTERKVKKLFLPIFDETRFEEKDEADTTEYCESL